MKTDDEGFDPEDPKHETLGPIVVEKLNEIEFDDIKMMEKIIHSNVQKMKPLQLVPKQQIQLMIKL